MSDLPQTDELRRSDESYDAVRVEEAFASFAERVQELESVAGELREELRALRQERLEQERLERRPRSSERYEEESWPVEGDPDQIGREPTPDWIASVPAPLTRSVAMPRFALEAMFLVLVALFAGLADLSTIVIVSVMTTALALVVLSEVATATKRARWRLDAVAGPLGPLEEGASESTGPWSMPVVEATVVEAPDHSESHTVVTKLPPELEPEPEPALSEPEPEPDAPESNPDLSPEPTPEPDPIDEPEPSAEAQPEAVAESALAEPESAQAEAEPDETAEPEEVAPADAETGISESEASIPAAPEPESEPEPRRRFSFLRRKRRAEDPADGTPDPWEI